MISVVNSHDYDVLNRADAPIHFASMQPAQFQEILAARIYSDLPGRENILQFRDQGRILTDLKKTLALLDIYKFDILYAIFFPLIILTKGLLFLLCLVPISQLDGVRNYLGKNKYLIAKSKNRGITKQDSLDLYAHSLRKESFNRYLPPEFQLKNDISLHPQGCGICRGSVLEFVRLLSLMTMQDQMTARDIALIASQFSNGAPANAVILQRLHDAIGDELALKDYNISLDLGTKLNEKDVLDHLQNVDAGVYSIMSSYHSTLFIKIRKDLMFFFDPLHGTYSFSSLEEMRPVILHDRFFSEYKIGKISY